MKKKLLNFIAFYMAAMVSICAQKTSCHDVLYLKNGSTINGYVVEMIPDSSKLKLVTYDGSVFVYNLSEVLKVEKVDMASNNNKNKAPSAEGDKPIYTNMTDLNTFVPSTAYVFALGIRTAHGVRFNKHFSLMGGIGYERIFSNIIFLDNPHLLTAFTRLKVDLLKNKVTPTCGLDLGGGVLTQYADVYPLFFMNPFLGVRMNVFKKMSIDIALGYQFSQLYDTYPLNMHALNFKLGLSF